MIGITHTTCLVPFRPWTTSATRRRYRYVVSTRPITTGRRFAATDPEYIRKESTSLLSSPYDREIASVALPTLCVGLLGPLCTAVDTALVGQLGTVQLSGVAFGAVVYTFVANLFLFLQFLVTPAVSSLYAAEEKDELSLAIARSIGWGLLCGCSCGLVVFLFSGAIIDILGPVLEVREYAVTYTRVMATGIPPFVFYQSLAGILRGIRQPIVIFKASFIATMLNIILDYIFIFRTLSHQDCIIHRAMVVGFGWGVFGAGLATSIGTYVSTGIMLRRVLTCQLLKIRDLFPDERSETSGVHVFGDSIALIIRTLTLLTLVVTSSVLISKQGPITHSAFEVCRLVFLMAHVTYTAFDVTMQTICAAYIGKGDKIGARAVLIRAVKLVLAVTSLLSGGLLIFADGFIRIFTSSLEVIEKFRRVALTLLLPIPLAGVAATVDGSLLGASRFKFVAAMQFLVGSVGLGGLILFHQRQILTLGWSAVFVRIGLSSQIFFTWAVAFLVEYKKRKSL